MASSSARSLPSLKSIAHAVLRPLWHTVDDVGDASFDLLRDLLAQSTATQLHAIEEASPHLIADTEVLWKQLAIKDFVKVRIAVEDGTMTKEPKSWRALHEDETIQQQERMEAVLQKMRGAYKSHSDDRKTSRTIDGVQMAKRRKLNSMVSGTTRPKSLMEKARVNSKRIQTIYAPKRRRGIPMPAVPPPPAPTPPATSKLSGSRVREPIPPPKIHTITRTVKVLGAPRPRPAPAPGPGTSSTSSLTISKPSSTSQMSPPTTTLRRPVLPLPSHRPSASSPFSPKAAAPPPSRVGGALSPPPRSAPVSRTSSPAVGGARPSAKAINSIFLKRPPSRK